MRLIKSKITNNCIYCGCQLKKGTSIYWQKDLGVCCETCYCEEYQDNSDYDNLTPYNTYNDNYVSNVYHFSSGHVAYQNKNGRCEDAPCCGCCTC